MERYHYAPPYFLKNNEILLTNLNKMVYIYLRVLLMKIEDFYKVNMCPNCSKKCNKKPHIDCSIIIKPYQKETQSYCCEQYSRAD